MMNQNLAQARIVVATLTLLSRELKETGPPFSLWQPFIQEKFIRSLGLSVARGEAVPLWVEDRHPGRGFLIYRHNSWESEFSGYPCGKLEGPFMVVEDPQDRQNRSRRLATHAIMKARTEAYNFLSLKCIHDPAILNGFLATGFTIAEIGSSLYIDIKKNISAKKAPAGFSFLTEFDEPERLANEFGDFFYDGRHRADPLIGPAKAARLWTKIAQDDLSGQAHPAIILWDNKKNAPAGLATCRPLGDETSSLSILTLMSGYWGQALGRHLLEEVLTQLATAGCKRLLIETAAYNLPALKTYQALGAKPYPSTVSLHFHVK